MMKKILEVIGAVFLAFVDGKKVAMELNETPEQPRTKRKESPKQVQTLKAVLHT
ncbi:hypothetical protein [Bacillus cereus]|uniref:Uncharacterized protein n=1 Tax=Bacillus cereus TaxID=1396 RepID=A0A2A7HS28_BACCE|nr:hypothetical protein [Bacillus cereus]PEC19768.1 hypothetical protein COM96_23295 [Bacillus cereus]